ncbi:hypothetical protein [Paenibacillus wynnii]|uniref:Uncharacterized protein n=1 Tax=Paenibacillus wynnii TaxID=268407 RepID=A0A098MGP2_9BACL|nr:hypothetical protein [Paenibacillus wynnii]KGE20644.1 hypothetical protein PWYN_00075 [Paenibacillus wynnii]KGE20702.1 hypothetical protein PWYN_00500 [Paenibacillus wynnii]
MNLRDQIRLDTQNTFLNLNEFADVHIIDGQSVKAVLDQATDDQHPLAYAEGISLVKAVLYVDSAELGYIPKQDQRMTIDGKGYFAVRVATDLGMMVISLEANTD